jgi:hypothetical protein
MIMSTHVGRMAPSHILMRSIHFSRNGRIATAPASLTAPHPDDYLTQTTSLQGYQESNLIDNSFGDCPATSALSLRKSGSRCPLSIGSQLPDWGMPKPRIKNDRRGFIKSLTATRQGQSLEISANGLITHVCTVAHAFRVCKRLLRLFW